MKITKELKYASFEWDDELKEFTLDTTNQIGGNVITLNKVYSFAFMRFVIRMAQRNWYRKTRDSSTKKAEKDPVDLADHPWENPDQMTLEELDAFDAINLDKTPF